MTTAAAAVFGLLLAILAFGGCVLLLVLALALLVKLVRRFVPDERPRQPLRRPAPARVMVPAAPVRQPARAQARPARRDPPPRPRPEPVDQLVQWRYEQLVALGVDREEAVEASRAGIDTSGVRSLVERGCRPRVAVAILRPDHPLRPRRDD